MKVPQLDQRTDRVFRSGSWLTRPVFARVADRYWYTPGARLDNLGFRLAFRG